MFKKSLEAVKSAVSVEEYAGEYIELKPCGNTLRGVCPIHGGDNPHAFAVRVDLQRWRCFRCDLRGDLIDLAKYLEGHNETWTAMVSLAMRYGIELPQRPPSWYAKQSQKNAVEAKILDAVADTYQRRYFRTFGGLALENIADEEEREEEARRLFKGFRTAAEAAARNRWERRRG